MKGYIQYRDVKFCKKYLGCCGTCITRNEQENICLATDGDYTNMVTENDFTCDFYMPCELADKLSNADEYVEIEDDLTDEEIDEIHDMWHPNETQDEFAEHEDMDD